MENFNEITNNAKSEINARYGQMSLPTYNDEFDLALMSDRDITNLYNLQDPLDPRVEDEMVKRTKRDLFGW